jgi:hypothetical protein
VPRFNSSFGNKKNGPRNFPRAAYLPAVLPFESTSANADEQSLCAYQPSRYAFERLQRASFLLHDFLHHDDAQLDGGDALVLDGPPPPFGDVPKIRASFSPPLQYSFQRIRYGGEQIAQSVSVTVSVSRQPSRAVVETA